MKVGTSQVHINDDLRGAYAPYLTCYRGLSMWLLVPELHGENHCAAPVEIYSFHNRVVELFFFAMLFCVHPEL